jgi:hypothetical protein
MTWLAIALLLSVDSFWQVKPPMVWTDAELAQFLAESPWAQMSAQPGKSAVGKNAGSVPPIQVYLATAGPIVKALAERDRRAELRRPGTTKALADDPLSEERAVWFSDNREMHIIVAARVGNNEAFSKEAETRRLEQDSSIDAGHGRVKLSAYFPPTSTDPHIYFAFPRELVSLTDKVVSFELYLPGAPGPYRTLQFKIKDLLVDGKLEL